jgi:hypothetical protein
VDKTNKEASSKIAEAQLQTGKKKKLMDNTSKNVALVFQNNLRQDNSMQAAILRTASRAINNVDWL